MSISVLIITKDEEIDLPECLESVSWCDDIHVFDSFSTDKTKEIAIRSGASVTQRIFDGYASQRNAALSSLKFKNSWVLILDADERVPKHLGFHLRRKVENVQSSVNGFRLRRRDYFGSTWLKYSQISPFYIRLIRVGKAFYHREINEVLQVDGRIEDINDYFNHYPFSKGIRHWINKHNIYSSMEAIQWIEMNKVKEKFSLRKALFNRDFSNRRYHQKGLFYKLPGRTFIKWMYMVFIRLAFLDGKAGLTYATLQAIYEYFIVVKTRELLNKKESELNKKV